LRCGSCEQELNQYDDHRLHTDQGFTPGSLRFNCPHSGLGEAIKYALNQWSALERFIEHGEVEIDNNLENSIRPTAVGKKDWLFFGSEVAGARNAVI
jgi:hypothetical protein